MRLRKWQTVLSLVLVAAVVLLLAAPADAQCSMCRAALNGSNNARFLKYFNIGVLVLLPSGLLLRYVIRRAKRIRLAQALSATPSQ